MAEKVRDYDREKGMLLLVCIDNIIYMWRAILPSAWQGHGGDLPLVCQCWSCLRHTGF